MTHEEFLEKECMNCGTQRCYGVEYCHHYKKLVKGEDSTELHPMAKMQRVAKQQILLRKAIHDEELGLGEEDASESAEMSDEDKEFALAAQEAHDNMVRGLIEAGAENHALVEDRNRLIGALKKAVEWLNYFIRTEPDDVYHDEVSADTWAIECILMDMEETE